MYKLSHLILAHLDKTILDEAVNKAREKAIEYATAQLGGYPPLPEEIASLDEMLNGVKKDIETTLQGIDYDINECRTQTEIDNDNLYLIERG